MTKETEGTRDILWAGRDGVAKLSQFPVATLNHLYMVRFSPVSTFPSLAEV